MISKILLCTLTISAVCNIVTYVLYRLNASKAEKLKARCDSLSDTCRELQDALAMSGKEKEVKEKNRHETETRIGALLDGGISSALAELQNDNANKE